MVPKSLLVFQILSEWTSGQQLKKGKTTSSNLKRCPEGCRLDPGSSITLIRLTRGAGAVRLAVKPGGVTEKSAPAVRPAKHGGVTGTSAPARKKGAGKGWRGWSEVAIPGGTALNSKLFVKSYPRLILTGTMKLMVNLDSWSYGHDGRGVMRLGDAEWREAVCGEQGSASSRNLHVCGGHHRHRRCRRCIKRCKILFICTNHD